MTAPLRFLQVASRYQVQLGWLRVIAQTIGDGRMGIEGLAEVLLSHREQFNGWWEQAHLEGPARGIAQPATANRAARIGVTYGIHDPDSGRLTALGQVLRHAAPWGPGDSPLAWQGGARWLGLWLTMSAAGDVLLRVLRTWPEAGLDAEDAPGFLAATLRGLAQHADADARRQLLDQAGRSSGKLRFSRNFLIYPYLEPLRDLGYLRTAGRAGGYELTETGVRLQAALRDERDASSWLQDGLHGAYLAAAGLQTGAAPPPAAIARTPPHLPASLGGPEGADVLPILLMAQAKLAEPEAAAAALELAEGHTMLRRAAGRSSGQLQLVDDRLQWTTLSPDLWSAPPTETASPAPTPPAPTPPAQLTPRTSHSTRAWLQATAALLQEPTPGGPLCWGGPRAALAALRHRLETGLPRSGAPLAALQSALPHAVEGQALLRRVAERWDSELPDDALLATIRRAQLAADTDRAARVRRLKVDLTAADAIAQTAALLGDAIAADGWRSAELLDQLCRRIGALGEDAGALAFLDDLTAPDSPHTYVRLLDLPQPAGRPLPTGRLGAVEITDGSGGQRQAWVSITAPCPAAALRRARAQVDEALVVCCYAARLPLPEGPRSETLSPPPPAPAPLPDALLLPTPPRPPLLLSGLSGPLLPLVTAVAKGTPIPQLGALPEAAAIGGIRTAIVADVFAAEVALHRAALARPEPEVLAAITDWRGAAISAAYREISTLAPLLRPLRLPQPAPQSPAQAAALLARVDCILPVIEREWPWLVTRLSRWAAALSEPTIWADEGIRRRDRARGLLLDAPPPILAALLDPVIEEASAASRDELTLHWAGVKDRFDDLVTLTGPVSLTRLAELLGLQ